VIAMMGKLVLRVTTGKRGRKYCRNGTAGTISSEEPEEHLKRDNTIHYDYDDKQNQKQGRNRHYVHEERMTRIQEMSDYKTVIFLSCPASTFFDEGSEYKTPCNLYIISCHQEQRQ
jgi:hypothetical protein